ncbi:MAG TPA: hypothetical protein VGB77_06585 [Abditibacteriaceae bacterium]|jgi:hypothetical protein
MSDHSFDPQFQITPGVVNAVASPATAFEFGVQLEEQATTPAEQTLAKAVLDQAYAADKKGQQLGLHLPGLNPGADGRPVCIDGDTLLKSLAANSLNPKPTPVRINHTLDALGEYTGIQDTATLTGHTMGFLEAVSRTPAVQLIIRTRQRQAARWCKRSRSRGLPGFGIRQIEEKRQLTGAAAKEREALEDFVIHGGYRYDTTGQLRRREFDNQPGVWDGRGKVLAGGLQALVHRMVRNALAMDWAPVRFEPSNDEKAMPVAWFSNADVDAKQIRRTYEEKYVPQIDRSGLPIAFIELEPGTSASASMVYREFPWNRMAVMVRNPRTDFFGMGYGYGETEASLDLLASMILNLKFRAEYFDNNHIPPAIVALRGQLAGFSDNSLSALRTQLAMKTGSVGAFFRLLYLGLPADPNAGIEILPLRNATGAVNEMEYAHSDFQALMVLLCALFGVDPVEVGYGSQSEGSSLNEADPETRIEHSQDKGLVPLLEAIADFINKHILQFLNPDFEFYWEGLNKDDEATDEALKTRFSFGDTANELKDIQDLPRDLHAKDTILWTKTARRFARDKYATTEEWRDKVEAAYEKEFAEKYGDDIEAWSTAWDEPAGNVSMMQTIGAEKSELQAAKQQQQQIKDLIAQGHSPEEAKQIAQQQQQQMAMDGQPGGQPGEQMQGQMGAQDGQPQSQAGGQAGGQNGYSPFDLDAQHASQSDAQSGDAQNDTKDDKDDDTNDDPYEIEPADDDQDWERQRPNQARLGKSIAAFPNERIIRIVRV